MSHPQLTVLIPAAGPSSRLGQAKQLVYYKTGTLIQNAVSTAYSISPKEVIVVTGAKAEDVRGSVRQTSVRWAHNPHWKDGMGSSIATGAALIDQGSSAVMIFLCDQWRLQTSDLQLLSDSWLANPERIVCARASDRNMPPVIFPSRFFSNIKELSGDNGAQSILEDHAGTVKPVLLDNAAWDLDLKSQLKQLSLIEL